MHVQGGRPGEEQLRRNFDNALAAASAGHGVRSESGLDEPTQRALFAVAGAYPEIPQELTDAARAAFAGQLDGSNAAGRRAEFERKFSGLE
ncbi:hypothetical protein [Nocardia yamanashiensis]|uniref:hypothetical protein n=1 Tax=Nocardia yamanashiensis TaxID=209247 RepID=UPI000829853A